LWRGNKSPLDHEDLDPVREEDCASRRTKRLEEIWNNEKIAAKCQKNPPKLWKALIKYFTLQEHALVVFSILFNVFGDVLLLYSITSLMKAVSTDFEQGAHSPNEYVIFVWGMVIGSFCEVISSQHSRLLSTLLGIRAKAALVGLIYKKVSSILYTYARILKVDSSLSKCNSSENISISPPTFSNLIW
jgi:hypothetical protein